VLVNSKQIAYKLLIKLQINGPNHMYITTVLKYKSAKLTRVTVLKLVTFPTRLVICKFILM